MKTRIVYIATIATVLAGLAITTYYLSELQFVKDGWTVATISLR